MLADSPIVMKSITLLSYVRLAEIYLDASEGRQVGYAIAVVNVGIWVGWRIPALRPFMMTYLTHRPLGGKTYTMLTSMFRCVPSFLPSFPGGLVYDCSSFCDGHSSSSVDHIVDCDPHSHAIFALFCLIYVLSKVSVIVPRYHIIYSLPREYHCRASRSASSITDPTTRVIASHPHCPTMLTPSGQPSPSAPTASDTLSAGRPAREAGTVRTPCVYASSPACSSKCGAVQIADGCNRTRTPGSFGAGERASGLGTRKTHI